MMRLFLRMSMGINNILIILSEIHQGGISDFATRTHSDQRWAERLLKVVGIRGEIRLQKRFLLPCLECCDFAGLTPWLSSGKLVEKTMTRAEVEGHLIHALSIMQHRIENQLPPRLIEPT